ncbi:hypothetical protein [Vreelandella maris]|uniref:hypothetical protein n=1 Tax=Vreelandella maris TaxID=2729617 RepID=UPI0030EF74A7|tara:strand:+ start:116 stop:442 length:327 start_codon:yes stop_codon:yes gene_type:complete
MSEWKVTGAPRFVEGVGMVYAVTKGGSCFDVREQEELEALLAGWISVDDPPKDSQLVIAAQLYGETADPDAAVCLYMHGDFYLWMDGIEVLGDAAVRLDMNVTHWKPL